MVVSGAEEQTSLFAGSVLALQAGQSSPVVVGGFGRSRRAVGPFVTVPAVQGGVDPVAQVVRLGVGQRPLKVA